MVLYVRCVKILYVKFESPCLLVYYYVSIVLDNIFYLRFGDDCICVDGTHGLNGYGFELHTILVIDDMREGYPAAFFISNRSDAEVMKFFFSCVETHIDKKIRPRVFMSDMADAYYNAWVEVMFPAEFR